eukprot:s2039_g8.t1
MAVEQKQMDMDVLADAPGDGNGDAFAAAEAYAERCKRLAMPVEPSIAVWLRLGGGSLQVPFQSSLLPACEFLAQSQGLKKLSFRSASAPRGTGNANARVLRTRLGEQFLTAACWWHPADPA